MTTRLFVYLASTLESLRSARARGQADHAFTCTEEIARIASLLPSGAGIDSGTTIVVDECTDKRIVLSAAFHHMNDAGYYDGWTHHKIILTPDWGSFAMRITGRDRNQIKDYLYEVYDHALRQEIELTVNGPKLAEVNR